MRDDFRKLKIPTVLGLGIIIAGIISGLVLTFKEQIITSKAAPDISPQNITLTNITDNSVTVSWQTSTPVSSFITFGQTNPKEQTTLDDRDANPSTNPTSEASGPKPYSIHYFTIKNLLPKTTYQYRIVSGTTSSAVSKFTTATPLSNQTEFRPIIGSIINNDKPLDEGVVYLSIADASTDSSLVRTSGNFLIPLSQLRTSDLSGDFSLTKDTIAKLTIISNSKQTSVLFRLSDLDNALPPIKIGEDLDLVNVASPTPAPVSNQDLDKYDLNADGKINSTDYAIILQNFGRNPKNKKADLNGDGVVDQKDLDLLNQKLKDIGSQ